MRATTAPPAHELFDIEVILQRLGSPHSNLVYGPPIAPGTDVSLNRRGMRSRELALDAAQRVAAEDDFYGPKDGILRLMAVLAVQPRSGDGNGGRGVR